MSQLYEVWGKYDLETEELKTEHALKCKTNYSGEAQAIEPEGAKRIFNEALSKFT